MSRKKALITGVTGQDGAYLSEFLLENVKELNLKIRRVPNIKLSYPDWYSLKVIQKTVF